MQSTKSSQASRVPGGKNYKPKQDFAYRICAGQPTSAMPKPNFMCAPAFNIAWWWHLGGRVCVVCRRWWCLRCDVVGVEVMWLVVKCHVMRHLMWCDFCPVMSCDVINDVTSPYVKWCDAMGRDLVRLWCDVVGCEVGHVMWLNVVCAMWWISRWCAVNHGEPMTKFCDSVLQRSIPCATKYAPVLKSTTKYQVLYFAHSSLLCGTKYSSVL